jgi:sugar/nucleoside kinase (ribokinase family)
MPDSNPQPRQFDVAVIGNVGIDTNVYFHGRDIDFNVEANFTENLDYVGQAGGYASRGYAQLGKKTAFIGHVGDDFSGRLIRETLARDGTDLTALFTDPAGTARSINFMYPDGRRKNFYDGKGHMTLQPSLKACREVLAQVKLAHFNIPNWARQLLPIARELGVTIACDLQDVVQAGDGYRRDFVEYADILFFSSVNYADPSPLIGEFLGACPQRVVICGLGARGCAAGSQAGIQFFGPVSLEAPVIDTNGAGDALAVGFLSSYVLEGRSLEDSIRRGQIAARYTCTLKATSSGLITPEKLEHYFRSI